MGAYVERDLARDSGVSQRCGDALDVRLDAGAAVVCAAVAGDALLLPEVRPETRTIHCFHAASILWGSPLTRSQGRSTYAGGLLGSAENAAAMSGLARCAVGAVPWVGVCLAAGNASGVTMALNSVRLNPIE